MSSSGSEQPGLSVIIVSYNTREMTLRCLEALCEHLPADRDPEVIVVDNASSDGSAAAIETAFPRVQLIRSEQNIGFGPANNLAFRIARGQDLLLLNSDAFVSAGAIETLATALRQEERVAVVGPRLMNGDGSLQRSAYRFPTPAQAWLENTWLSRVLAKLGVREDFEAWPHDQARSVPWLIGACMLVRREVVDELGGFDESFFLYAEETDWQRRMRDAGYEVRLVPDAAVMHLGGSSGASDKPKVNAHFFDGLDRYTLKHHGTLGLVSLRLAMVVGCSLRATAWAGRALSRLGDDRAWTKAKFHGWLLRRQLFQRPPALNAPSS